MSRRFYRNGGLANVLCEQLLAATTFAVMVVTLAAVWLVPLANGEGADTPYAGSFPATDSKKGLQVELVDDAIALGVRHAAINVNLAQVVAPGLSEDHPDVHLWTHHGQQYRMRRTYVQQLDEQIRRLTDAGALVYVILLAYESDDAETNRVLLHPEYDRSTPNHLAAFNVATNEGRRWLESITAFLAERWSRPTGEYGQVAGYIVGNEVNSHWFWSNRGRVGMEQFADEYLLAMRIVHGAIRSQATWPRVYLSLDHHWNIRYAGGDELQTFAGKAFVDYFARRALETPGGDFDWHIAYHPYPENLFKPMFWNDQTAPDSFDAPRITFKNLQVLPRYLQRSELLHEGRPRRIILSEQGFHTPDGPDGEAIQAAAYCYAYRRVAGLEGIDAFILHRHIDHPNEGGLMLGLRRRSSSAAQPYPKKMIYECFRAADTPRWQQAFQFALPIAGLDSWDDI